MILNRSFVDVHDILTDALTTIQSDLQEKTIVLFVNLRAKFPQVEGDAVRLQQIFWNVLKNAVKFTPRDGQITVETSVNHANQLITKITDTGIGMNTEELARVFSAFAQGDHAGDERAHRFGGLGLGLAISQNLASLHAGKISAHSGGNNQGSVFIIELPLAAQAKNNEAGARVSARPASPETPGQVLKPWRILLVEDHETTRTVLSQLLVRRNYTVVAADCVANARRLARQEKFDLLISDIGLPDGNGNDLMKEFRDNYGLRGIALTGYGMDEDVARGQAAGFITHLIKPVGIQSLEHALAQVKQAV
jgi:CheY-like chemotaxis protein